MKAREMPDDLPMLWVHNQGDESKICLTWRDITYDVDAGCSNCGPATRALSLRGAAILAAELNAAVAAVQEHLAYPAREPADWQAYQQSKEQVLLDTADRATCVE